MTTNSPQRYHYGTGRRKSAVARVRLYPGNGSVIVNGKDVDDLFSRASQRIQIEAPFKAVELQGKFNAQIKCVGGGMSGWAGAIQLGIARALLASDETLRRPLRRAGLLTRDARIKERKKPGLKRARKAPQYTKR